MDKPLRQIRQAEVDEASLAAAIWREAAAWAKDGGHPYWRDQDLQYEMAQARAAQSQLILGLENELACACMLMQDSDPIYWPEVPDRSALYLHRLAVKRAHAGRGWGSALIAWAVERAASAGVPLRLDCAPRSRLMNLYTSNGFLSVDTGPVERGGFSVIRFERRPH